MRKFNFAPAALIGIIGLFLGGCEADTGAGPGQASAIVEKGPVPWLSPESRYHIEVRHVRTDAFPEKSKFAPGVAYESLVGQAYREASRALYERERWVYDWDAGFPVGKDGENACRLVTEKNGEVVTFYPSGSIGGDRES